MDKIEIIKCLKDADNELAVVCKIGEKIPIYIVGGSALILSDYTDRATADIDVLNNLSRSISEILDRHNINSRVVAYCDNFPYNFEDRLIKFDVEFTFLNVFVLSLEDVVLSKLCEPRIRDCQDIENDNVVKSLNWDLLESIVNNNEMDNSFNEAKYRAFLINYRKYVGKYRP